MKTSSKILLCLVLITGFISCKKDTIQNDEPFEKQMKEITVSARGYLIFPSTESLVNYGKLIAKDANNSTTAQLVQKGFKKFEANISSSQGSGNNPYSDFFDENGFLQVSNIILKLSSDQNFVYTLDQAMADSTNYNNMFNEVYNAVINNKINVDRDFNLPFEFSAFMNSNPNGQNETLNTSSQRRKMFGSSTNNYTTSDPPMYNGYGNCQVCTHSWSQTTTYFLWIGNNHSPVYQGTTCTSSTMCD
jgi:hypothetical protein